MGRYYTNGYHNKVLEKDTVLLVPVSMAGERNKLATVYYHFESAAAEEDFFATSPLTYQVGADTIEYFAVVNILPH